MNRIVGLDVLRGVAVILMVIFHFCYDLNYFGYWHIEITRASFWVNFRSFIVFLFLFIMGVSLALTHHNGIKWKKVKLRTGVLLLSAFTVTVATYVMFPKGWVYFGVLHAITLFSLIGLIFIGRALLSFVLGIFILVLYNFFSINMHLLFRMLKEPLYLPHFTVDLVPFLPWFGVVLLGIALVGYGLERRVFQYSLFSGESILHKQLAQTGRHTLLVYLLHQPLLFGILWTYSIL